MLMTKRFESGQGIIYPLNFDHHNPMDIAAIALPKLFYCEDP
jgi:hypothetical protein